MNNIVTQNILMDGKPGFQMTSEEELIHINNIDWKSRDILFDDNWRFFLGEMPEAQNICFNDSGWLRLSLPHDYSINQPYSPNMEAESGYLPGGVGWYRKGFFLPRELSDKRICLNFDGVYMNASVWINGTKLGTHPYGYTPFSFDLTPYLIFEAENVLAIRVDHKIPSSRWYSGSGIYRSVSLTVTGGLHIGLNGIAISAPELEQEVDSPVSIRIKTMVDNESDIVSQVFLRHTIYKKNDPEKKVTGTFISANPVTILPGESSSTVDEFVTFESPQLWSTESPAIYIVKTELIADNNIKDLCLTDFGFRFFYFDQDAGFFLNGKAVKLKGVCMHHDQGALGAAAHKRAIQRQVEILADMGCNSIRMTHNPASKSLIELCSQKGILVIEEIFDGWHGSKNGNTEDYGKWFGRNIEKDNAILGKYDGMTWEELDLKSTLKRDINAPCIIMWSLGNEIMEGIGINTEEFPAKAAQLIAWAQEIDGSRPVTTGDNKLKYGHAESISISRLLQEAGGIIGINYATLDELDCIHKNHPTYKIYGSETASSINSRGVYNPRQYDRQFTAYDEARVGWGHYASQAWYDTVRKDYVAGEYVWTGFDYIGEPTNYNGIGPGIASHPWPSPKHSYFGIIDTAGFPKDSYYLYQSLWNNHIDTLHILPAWNGNVVEKNEDGQVKVVVYTNAPSVELFFAPFGTGKKNSLGKKTFTVKSSEGGGYTYQLYEGNDRSPDQYRNLYLTWMLPYEDGTLSALAYDESGNIITNTSGRSTVTTAGKSSKLMLTADRTAIHADGRDLCYITAEILDQYGHPVSNANDRIRFQIHGHGEIMGIDNGLSVDHDPYQTDNRNAFNGKALIIVRFTDKAESFTLEASASGLISDSVTVETHAVASRPLPDTAVKYYKIAKNQYVMVGNMPVLPSDLTIVYSDNTSAVRPVLWDNVGKEAVASAGSFVLQGKADKLTVSITVHILDNIASALNYSTAVPIGSKPILPLSRQMLGEDGRVLYTTLPVTWDQPEDSVYEKEGIVIIHGKVTVFNKQLPVTASIRVQAQTYAITSNVAPKSKLSQTIPPDLVSDTLGVITSEAIAGMEGIFDSPEYQSPERWSNQTYTEKQKNQPASIIFSYDTQEMLGQANIYFCRTEGPIRCPDPETTSWYISNTSPSGPWSLLKTQESINAAPVSDKIKRYTYNFEPVMVTYLRLEIHNAQTPTPPVPHGCVVSTGIAKVELLRAESRFIVNDSTRISSILLNGIQVPSDMLASGEVFTPVTEISSLKVCSDDHAAITVLPEHNGTIHIFTESEDHTKRSELLIHLGTEKA